MQILKYVSSLLSFSSFQAIPVDLVLKMSYFNGVDKGEGKEIAYFCIYSIFNDCS
jgi:hypothetical protein